MKKTKKFLAALCVVASAMATHDSLAASYYFNPNLADSAIAVTHANYDSTLLAGPVGPTRRLGPDEMKWKAVGPTASPHLYSGPYPNGKRVIWVGGYDRIAKLDADTLETLANYKIEGAEYYSDEIIEHHIATMNKLDDAARLDYNLKFWKTLFRYTTTFYRMLSRSNELYIAISGNDGSQSLRVYGETDAKDPASPIELRREWKIPADVSKARVIGINMTSDGWAVIVTQDGTLIALSSDFSRYDVLKLPNSHPELVARPGQHFFEGFVRNGLSTDDQRGVYVVTRDLLHRVQWTGSKLSTDEADGAWSAPYPNNSGIGSGTTPALMGWGPKEDRLVVITDGTKGNNFMAFWRDKIPDDWKGLPGLDRRVAGITPVHFGVSKTERAQIENALIVDGYSAFTNSVFSDKSAPNPEDPTKAWFTGVLQSYIPGHELRGGMQARWDPKKRKFHRTWNTQLNLAGSLCLVSSATQILYCQGWRNREFTIEGIDWNTGKSRFHYIIGKDFRNSNLIGVSPLISPNGDLHIDSTTGLGLLRLSPKGAGKK